MKLFHKQYAEGGAPLLVLHGLFGNQGNWAWHARELGGDFSVHSLDLRNHGRSPWSEEHDYPALARDVLDTMDALGLERAHLLGHSMGGKVAMQLAFMAPRRIARLLVVDIAPVTYEEDNFAPLEGMRAIEPGGLASRREADGILAAYVAEKPVRDFLLTNLRREEAGGFSWRCNLEALARNYPRIRAMPPLQGSFDGPTLFVKGSESDYLQERHGQIIMARFPKARFRLVANAGHWVHSEKPADFVRIARGFLAEK